MKVSNGKQDCCFRREQLTPVLCSNLKVNLKSSCVLYLILSVIYNSDSDGYKIRSAAILVNSTVRADSLHTDVHKGRQLYISQT